MTGTLKIAIGSIVLGLVVLALKTLAWWLTGSVALLSDALESIVNVAAAVAAVIAIQVAQRPADQVHPYGHDKAEFISAVLEGVLIILAALLILREAWGALQTPREIEQAGLGMAINAAASVLNGAWCWVLLREGRKRRSPALVADGKHLLTDVISSLGVLLGVGLALATGWMILDPILAMLVGINILWSGWKVTTASLSGLMDEAVPQATLRDIQAIISDTGTGAIEAHDLRTRHAGRATFIDFHLVVDGQTTVAEAHDICDRIETSLKDRLPDAQITIHVEPEHKAKHSGILVI
ncbi:MAG: cation diffusion facilitator family transporter [Paracoccus sp. (in: a-proteobacteria)]|uniref:cation diffusion facilitator family transporter n=1 Tax=Paracoccus sp. TaxID=267 RepID=UPI00391C90A4